MKTMSAAILAIALWGRMYESRAFVITTNYRIRRGDGPH
jgi:hypothetical protein